jgi:membrane protein required for colicin V production
MTVLDYAILGVVLVSLLIGIWRGAIREIFHIAGWVIAFFAARSLSQPLSWHLAAWIADPLLRVAMAWLSVFLVVLLIGNLVASLISGGVRKLGLGLLDHSLGAVVGLGRAGLFVLLATLAAGMTNLPQSPVWKEALFSPFLEIMALSVKTLLPESLARRISYQHSAPRKVL